MALTALHDLLRSPDPVAGIAYKMASSRCEKRAGVLDDASKHVASLGEWFGKQDPSLRYGLMGAGVGGLGGLGLSAFGRRKKSPWTTALSGALAGGALGAAAPLMQQAWQQFQGADAAAAGPEKTLADQNKHRPLLYGVTDAIRGTLGGAWDTATSLLPGGNSEHSLIPGGIGAGVAGAGLVGMRHLPGNDWVQRAQTNSLPKGLNKLTRGLGDLSQRAQTNSLPTGLNRLTRGVVSGIDGLSRLGEAREQYVTGRNVTEHMQAKPNEKGKLGPTPTAAESLERLRGQPNPPAPLGPVPTPAKGSAGTGGKGGKGRKTPGPLLPGLAEGSAQEVGRILDDTKLNKFQQRYRAGGAIAPHLKANPGAGGKAVRGRNWRDLVANLAVMAAGGLLGDFAGNAAQHHLGN